nr:DNA-3-methyladenine glycosylase [Paenibacillus protaetiae]
MPLSSYPHPENEMELEAPVPFDFNVNLDYLLRSPNECLYHIQGGAIHKAAMLPGSSTPAVFSLRSGESGNALSDRKPGGGTKLHIRLQSAIADCPAAKAAPAVGPQQSIPRAQLQAGLAAYVRDWLDLDRDLLPFYAMAEQDPLLRPLVQRYYGLRIMGIPDLFEALCWGIIGQQINLPFAYTLKKRLVETFGSSVKSDAGRLWLFPEPETIASLTVGDLTPLQLTTRKSEYLIGVARLMADGELSKAMLLEYGDTQAIARKLTGIRGIGPWTAHYVMMRCLRRPDAFPIDDAGLHNALKDALGLAAKPDKALISKLASGWSGWEAYAAFYLWRRLY